MTGLGDPSTQWFPYQYVVLRCVPHVDREEFVNVGVVVFSPDREFLAVAWDVDAERLKAFAPSVDPGQVTAGLNGIEHLCAFGTDQALGSRATAYGTREIQDTLGTRFGLIRAPRSTVIQPGPVHGGITRDPAAELTRLMSFYVR